MLPDQHTSLLVPSSASWLDTVWSPNTHIGFREGTAGSYRMVVTQASAENRSCDNRKVGRLILQST